MASKKTLKPPKKRKSYFLQYFQKLPYFHEKQKRTPKRFRLHNGGDKNVVKCSLYSKRIDLMGEEIRKISSHKDDAEGTRKRIQSRAIKMKPQNRGVKVQVL